MKTFNNSDLFTGYLKQLLHTFNLPKIKVYTTQHATYFDTHKVESPEILSTVEATPEDKTASGAPLTEEEIAKSTKNVRYFPYIKDGQIQEYVNDKWQNIRNNDPKLERLALYKYTYGDKILNYTKNLKIKSNTYDSYTHEYLGDYLRFHRDFLDLDLMPLYNCFSNRGCDKLNLNWTVSTEHISNSISFDSSDSNFKIYMVPVKLFKKYTVAIDSETPVEMCCGIYGDYQDKRVKFASLPRNTYKRVSKSVFSQPFLYDALAYTSDDTTAGYIDRILDSKVADKTTLIELAQNECDLKLFLKVPATNTSTIVILEGDYCTWNDAFWDSADTLGLATTQDLLRSSNVYLETSEDGLGYYPYIIEYETKKYLTFKLENGVVKAFYLTGKNSSGPVTPETVFYYNADLQTLTTTLSDDRTYAFGTRRDKKFTNIAPVDISTKPFVCKLYDYDSTNAVTNPQVGTAYKLGLRNTNIRTNKINYLFVGVSVSRDKKNCNRSIINLENLGLQTDISLPLITPLQLLQFNTKEQHPFADRLIEYLVGNAITNTETEVYDNIKRAQKALASNRHINNYVTGIPGIWSNNMRILFYEYMTSGADSLTKSFETNHDILGYVDKDVEKFYPARVEVHPKQYARVSLANIELEEGDK